MESAEVWDGEAVRLIRDWAKGQAERGLSWERVRFGFPWGPALDDLLKEGYESAQPRLPLPGGPPPQPGAVLVSV